MLWISFLAGLASLCLTYSSLAQTAQTVLTIPDSQQTALVGKAGDTASAVSGAQQISMLMPQADGPQRVVGCETFHPSS